MISGAARDEVPHLGKPINNNKDIVITRYALGEARHKVYRDLFSSVTRNHERVQQAWGFLVARLGAGVDVTIIYEPGNIIAHDD